MNRDISEFLDIGTNILEYKRPICFIVFVILEKIKHIQVRYISITIGNQKIFSICHLRYTSSQCHSCLHECIHFDIIDIYMWKKRSKCIFIKLCEISSHHNRCPSDSCLTHDTKLMKKDRFLIDIDQVFRKVERIYSSIPLDIMCDDDSMDTVFLGHMFAEKCLDNLTSVLPDTIRD